MNNPDPLQLPDAGIVTAQEYPHGVRCDECDDLLPNGTAYARVLDRDIDDCGVLVHPGCAVEAGR